MPIIDKTRPWKWYWGGVYSQPRYLAVLTHSFGNRVGWEESAQLAWVLSTVSAEGVLIDQVILGIDNPTTGIHVSGALPSALVVDRYALPSDRLNLTEMQTTFTRLQYRIDERGRIKAHTLFENRPMHRDSLSCLSRYMRNPK